MEYITVFSFKSKLKIVFKRALKRTGVYLLVFLTNLFIMLIHTPIIAAVSASLVFSFYWVFPLDSHYQIRDKLIHITIVALTIYFYRVLQEAKKTINEFEQFEQKEEQKELEKQSEEVFNTKQE